MTLRIWQAPIARNVLVAALLLVVLLGSGLSLAAPVRGQESEGTVLISPDFSSVTLDSGSFGIFIVLENLNHSAIEKKSQSDGLGAFEFTLQYDSTVVEVTDVEIGPGIESTGRNFSCFERRDEPGSFSYGCASLGSNPAGPQGTMTLASVTLEPVEAGSTFILLNAGIAGPLGEDVPVDVISVGVIDVEGGSAPTNTPAPGTTTIPPPPGTPTSPPAATATLQPGVATATPPPAGATGTPGDPTTATEDPDSTPDEAPTAATVSETVTGTPPSSGNDDDDEPDDGSGSGTVLLWSLLAVGGVVVVGASAVAAFRWQRGH